MKPTRVMLDVCNECFGGDWKAMARYAKHYQPTNSKPLGKAFRKLIGTRNRTEFWKQVALRNLPVSSVELVDGNSITGICRAIDLCRQGNSVAISIGGKLIGTLVPESELSN